MPIRIQRRRTKGWRMPEGAVSVTRPGKWGNPFIIGEWFKMGTGGNGMMYLRCLLPEYLTPDFTLIATPEMAVDWYRRFVSLYPLRDIEELRGHDLACWCDPSQPCHADVLLEIANGGAE